VVWLLVFGQGNRSRAALWVAAAILFGGILATLIRLHTSMGIAYGTGAATTGERWCTHVFISLYMGAWQCAAVRQGGGCGVRVSLWLRCCVAMGAVRVSAPLLLAPLSCVSTLSEFSFESSLRIALLAALLPGWTCVACVANVAIACTPLGGPVANGGLGAHVWSILLQLTVVRTVRVREGVSGWVTV
jgi:hypothetical protein